MDLGTLGVDWWRLDMNLGALEHELEWFGTGCGCLGSGSGWGALKVNRLGTLGWI